MLYDQMVKPRNGKSGLGREQRPVKKREDVHRDLKHQVSRANLLMNETKFLLPESWKSRD
jgi:hypothetical protein